jgi:hypothetical protein
MDVCVCVCVCGWVGVSVLNKFLSFKLFIWLVVQIPEDDFRHVQI